jgi:transcription antitermination factor NusG
VRYNGADAVIREDEINVLRRIEEKGYDAEASEISFAAGEKTTIAHGPFKGLGGIVERQSGKDVYTIKLESIGFSVKINVPSEVLIKD